MRRHCSAYSAYSAVTLSGCGSAALCSFCGFLRLIIKCRFQVEKLDLFWEKEKPFRITRNGVLQPKHYSVCLGLKRLAAATGLAGIGIGNFEPAPVQAVHEINDRTSEIICAERINEHRNPMALGAQVVGALFVKDQAILQAGAAPRFDVNPKFLASIFAVAGKQMSNLIGGAFGQTENDLIGGGHIHNSERI